MEQVDTSQGIIYRAFNTITNKSYIGQTTRNIEIRKYAHLYHSKTKNYKFSRALKKYKEENWIWSILEVIEVQQLNERENYFINQFNSVKNGYNTLEKSTFIGQNNPKYNPTVYELYHPETGIIKETISQLSIRHKAFGKYFYKLLNGEYKSIKDFVLAENKDNYDEIIKLYEFYHPNYGIIKCKIHELNKQYLLKAGIKNSASNLVCGYNKHISGWILYKDINNYNDLVNRGSKITLSHSEYGVKTMYTNEFARIYGLNISSISNLKNGKYKSTKGWKLHN